MLSHLERYLNFNPTLYSPVQLDQWKVYAEFLMELCKLAIRAEQMRGIELIVSCYLQYIHVILLHAVMLLETHHFHYLQASILLHTVK